MNAALKSNVQGARKSGLKARIKVSSSQAAKTTVKILNIEETFLSPSLRALSPTMRQYNNAVTNDVTTIPQNTPLAHVMVMLLLWPKPLVETLSSSAKVRSHLSSVTSCSTLLDARVVLHQPEEVAFGVYDVGKVAHTRHIKFWLDNLPATFDDDPQ
jgi:hypothetical protein